MLDLVERYSSHMLVYLHVVALFFTNKPKAAIVTGQNGSAGAQLPLLPDDNLEAEPLLAALARQEKRLLSAVRFSTEISVDSSKYASSVNLTVRLLFEVTDRT